MRTCATTVVLYGDIGAGLLEGNAALGNGGRD